MTPLAVLFVFVNALLLFGLSRRWAPLPLLVGACYMTLGQGILIGPFSFTVIRMLLFVGAVRVALRGEWLTLKLQGMDWIAIFWGVAALSSSFFHRDPAAALVYRLGVVYNSLGIYFLIRIFCRDLGDVVHLIKLIALLLTPVALEMILEQLTARNLFAIFGRVQEDVMVRSDRLRAQGPFAHAILAGTVAAACIPFMVGIWRRNPARAKVGMFACVTMVFTCASSGPLMSTIFSLFALWMWRWRRFTGRLRWAAVGAYLVLDNLMDRPAYFLIQKFDLTGSSTGWHRAELIHSSIVHLDEWWLGGTDRTRHWMPTGVSYDPEQTDITNQYIANGVQGGLPLMFMFIATLWIAFVYVSRLAKRPDGLQGNAFLVWALGASLFAHAASGMSVAYFDQSVVFLYMTLAMICSVYASAPRPVPPAATTTPESLPSEEEEAPTPAYA